MAKFNALATVKIAAIIIGILTFVDLVMTIVALESFDKEAAPTLRSHLAIMIYSSTVAGLALVYLAIDLYLELVGPRKNHNLIRSKLDPFFNSMIWKMAVPLFVLVSNGFASVITLFSFLNVPFLEWISYSGTGSDLGPTLYLKCFEAIGLGLQLLFVLSLTVALWWPYVMFAECIVAVSAKLQFLITISCVLINNGVVRSYRGHHHMHNANQIYTCLSLFLAITAFLGINLILSVKASNRLSSQTSRLGRFYIMICSISTVLCLVWFIHSIVVLIRYTNDSDFHDDLVANPILAGVGFLLDLVCIACVWYLRATPQTKLKVQEYDLNALNPEELSAWALVIDTYNAKMSRDISKGANALELMMAYVNSPMPGFSCKVMRVYDPKSGSDDSTANGRSYEHVRAWNQLDADELFEEVHKDTSSAKTLIEAAGSKDGTTIGEPEKQKPLSKNALKKAQRKAAKKNKPVDIPVASDEKSAEQLKREQDFRDTIMATEALFLLTTVENYDLAGTLKTGWFKSVISYTLGSKSWLKPLCVRLGIMGTHWPFRQMMFYTAPTKKPTARAAAILAAISAWNKLLKRSEKYTIILNPSYAGSKAESAFEMSKWVVTKMPASHVIDLRAYKGKTVKDYLKAIKYRNQATAFNQANGKVVETVEFSLEKCATAMNLWHNIAEKRTGEGHTAVLYVPTVDFLHSLGGEGHNQHGWRKLLFLEVDGEVIASCVLFFLGNTITSDIQGLEHDKARQYKAYFVMMQETISIALREGISFVDFGPTTSKPKQDIGASPVPILGGIKALPPLSAFVGVFAGQVDGG